MGVTLFPSLIPLLLPMVPDLYVWHSPAQQPPPTVKPGDLALAIFFCFPG